MSIRGFIEQLFPPALFTQIVKFNEFEAVSEGRVKILIVKKDINTSGIATIGH
jgi:hypothetical protein